MVFYFFFSLFITYSNTIYTSKLSISTTTIINNCLFQNFTSNQKGGAIFFSIAGSDLKILNCGFINISSLVNEGSAGAISIHNSKSVYFYLVCFLKCFCALYDPCSYLIASHIGTNLNSSLLYISESFCGQTSESGWSSGGGSNYFLYKCNNISSFSSFENLGGFSFLPISNSIKICEFSSIFNSSCKSFISSHGFGDVFRDIENCNYIQNEILSNGDYWIDHIW